MDSLNREPFPNKSLINVPNKSCSLSLHKRRRSIDNLITLVNDMVCAKVARHIVITLFLSVTVHSSLLYRVVRKLLEQFKKFPERTAAVFAVKLYTKVAFCYFV